MVFTDKITLYPAGFIPTASTQSFTSAPHIAFYGDKVFVGGSTSFSIYNETDTSPWNLISDTASAGITDMLVSEQTLMIARGASTVQFYDIYANNTLSAPTEILPFSSVSQLAFNSQYYFIVNAGLGVGIYFPNVGTPPTFTNLLSITDSISKIVVKNQLLFVATDNKVSIYDVSDPLQITTLSQYTISKGKIKDMILTDNRLILAKGIDGLEVLQAKNLGKHWVQSVKLSGERPITDKAIYNLTWTATTTSGASADTSFQLNYQHPPTVRSFISPQEVFVGNLYNKTFDSSILFSDLDGDPLELSVPGSPAWLSMRGDTLAGTPLSGYQGKYSLKLRADDGHTYVEALFTITVPNEAPDVVDSLRDISFKSGRGVNITIPKSVFSDPDNDPY